MCDTGGRPNDHALSSASRLVADDELAVALGDEIELVLIGVRVRVLRLARLEAVQSQHQATALEERRLELLVWIRPDTLAIIDEIRHSRSVRLTVSPAKSVRLSRSG